MRWGSPLPSARTQNTPVSPPGCVHQKAIRVPSALHTNHELTPAEVNGRAVRFAMEYTHSLASSVSAE